MSLCLSPKQIKAFLQHRNCFWPKCLDIQEIQSRPIEMRAKILYLANYRFYPECDVRLDHQSKVEDFLKCLMYSHAPGILIISRCFSTKNWFLIYPASIGDTLRNPPHYSDGRVKHHIQGRSDSGWISKCFHYQIDF